MICSSTFNTHILFVESFSILFCYFLCSAFGSVFLWPVSQRKHIRGALSKALMVLASSSTCWGCFSLAGGLPGMPQEPEVNDSRAEILVIELLAIDLQQ